MTVAGHTADPEYRKPAPTTRRAANRKERTP